MLFRSLAAPKLIEIFSKSLGGLLAKLNKYFKKGSQAADNEMEIAKSIIAFSHKWHNGYIKVLQYILDMTGVFAKANITNDADKKRATEMVYYILLAGLAVYSGVSSAEAFKSALESKDLAPMAGKFSIGAIETALAKVKVGEVKNFLSKIMK